MTEVWRTRPQRVPTPSQCSRRLRSSTNNRGASDAGPIHGLEADGTLDLDFASGLSLEFSASVWAVAVEPAGSVLAMGVFPGLMPKSGSGDHPSLVRLVAAGSQANLVVSERDAELGSPWCLNCVGDFLALGVLPDGDILLGGGFTSYQGVPRTNWVRLHGAPMSQPRIEQARIEGGVGVVGWVRGQAGRTYRLESPTDLLSWTSVMELASQGVRTEFRVPLTDSTVHRFFRILTR